MTTDDSMRAAIEAITRNALGTRHEHDDAIGSREHAGASLPIEDIKAGDGRVAEPAESLSPHEARALRSAWEKWQAALERGTPRVDRAAITAFVRDGQARRRRRAWALAASLLLSVGAGVIWRSGLLTEHGVPQAESQAAPTLAHRKPAGATSPLAGNINPAPEGPAAGRQRNLPRPKRGVVTVTSELAWDDQLDRRLAQMQKQLRRTSLTDVRSQSRFDYLQQRIDSLERDLRVNTL